MRLHENKIMALRHYLKEPLSYDFFHKSYFVYNCRLNMFGLYILTTNKKISLDY